MKKIILALLFIYPQTSVYSETYSSKYSSEIMGRGKLLHVDDSGTFYMQYKNEIHALSSPRLFNSKLCWY